MVRSPLSGEAACQLVDRGGAKEKYCLLALHAEASEKPVLETGC